jgi:hypothetical protein
MKHESSNREVTTRRLDLFDRLFYDLPELGRTNLTRSDTSQSGRQRRLGLMLVDLDNGRKPLINVAALSFNCTGPS